MRRGICPKCRKDRLLTRHHFKPKRFFRSSPTIRICRKCHDILETIIPKEKMSVKFYFWIVKNFLEGGEDEQSRYNPYKMSVW